jgi:epoxyqueuosine reductase QueG
MIKSDIKTIAYNLGADLCGIAPIDRFINAPSGFKPIDIYSKCKSVIVFAKTLPYGSINAESCVPYTHINTIITQEIDLLTYKLSLELQNNNIDNVIIPSDDPYEYWDSVNSYGRAILSLRHAGHLAGLGFIGKNTLLLNPKYGNMIQLGALLLNIELEGDSIIDYKCPDNCDLCVSNCPANALNGYTVDQNKCRPLSVYKNEKGYILKKCYICRKICPKSRGYSMNVRKTSN